MPPRKKILQPFIYRFSGCKRGLSDAGFYLTCYYNDPITAGLEKTSAYDNAMRFVWLCIYPPDDTNVMPFRKKWQEIVQSHGHFMEGPGWYSFVQTGPGGINSPLVFAPILCTGRREAHSIALSRMRREYKVPKKDVDTMQARINLLGTARLEAI